MRFKILAPAFIILLLSLSACTPFKRTIRSEPAGYEDLSRSDLILKLTQLKKQLEHETSESRICAKDFDLLSQENERLKTSNRDMSKKIKELEVEIAELTFAIDSYRLERNKNSQPR